jgi:beta-N-acetylhexosaminidase
MLDVEGLTLTRHEQEKINHPNTGAVILFSRNYQNPEQVTELINSIRAARNGDILIAVDQEGGRVQRFQNGFTALAACVQLCSSPGYCGIRRLVDGGGVIGSRSRFQFCARAGY